MLAVGWKKILTTAMPLSDCDSMCSTSLTSVVTKRSEFEVMRCFHLLRLEAGVVPDQADDRNVDVREDVGGRARDDDRGEQHDDERHHDERVGSSER